MSPPMLHAATVAAWLAAAHRLWRIRPWAANPAGGGSLPLPEAQVQTQDSLPADRRRSSGRAAQVLAVAGLGVLGALIWLPLGAAVAAAVPAILRWRRARTARRAQQRRAEELRGVVALLELSLSSGVSLRRGFAEVVPWSVGELHDALSGALVDAESEGSLADRLDELASGRCPELRGLCRIVAAAERDGAPAGTGLATLAAELRSAHRHELEQRARRLPVTLLLPLIVGVLPAFVLLSIVPMLATALANLTAT